MTASKTRSASSGSRGRPRVEGAPAVTQPACHPPLRTGFDRFTLVAAPAGGVLPRGGHMARSRALPLLLVGVLALPACGARLDPDTRKAAAAGSLQQVGSGQANSTGAVGAETTTTGGGSAGGTSTAGGAGPAASGGSGSTQGGPAGP